MKCYYDPEQDAISTTNTTRMLLRRSGKTAYESFAFFLCLGLLFLVFGLVDGFDILNLGMAVLGIGYSIFILVRARRINQSLEE